MEKTYSEKTSVSYECTSAEDWLELMTGVAIDYDGYSTVEGLKSLIDEMAEYAGKAIKCLHSGKFYSNSLVIKE